MSEHQCLEELNEQLGWDGPFERPIYFNRETNEMRADKWMIKGYKLTKAGNISNRGGGYLHINFCPICGEKLGEVDPPTPPANPPSLHTMTDDEAGRPDGLSR